MQIRLKPTDEVITSDDALQWIIDHIDPEAVEIIPDKAEYVESIKEALEKVDGPIKLYEVLPEPVEAVKEPADAKDEPCKESEGLCSRIERTQSSSPMPKRGRRALGDRIEQKPRRLDYDL